MKSFPAPWVKYKKIIFFAAVTASIIIGIFAGPSIEWQRQALLLSILRDTNLVLFGVLGAWFAIFYPLFVQETHQKNNQTDITVLLKGLFPALSTMTYSLVATLSIPFLVEVLGAIIIQSPYIELRYARMTGVAFIFFLFFLLILTIIYILIPFASLKRSISAILAKNEAQENYKIQKVKK